ncbi:MAG: rhamnogalacturonan acetylesterase [Treponema sp.]|nr:rhamnogalacturonan acetylesterase [Treponema sp.]
MTKTRLILAGDSTLRNGAGNGQWGWGDCLGPYFDAVRIEVINRAMGGRSSRTFISGGNWEEALALVRSGDFVFIQFGHNDAGPINDDSRARGTLPGIGEEWETIDNLLTGQRETVYSFGHYLRQYVRDTRTRDATPVLLSPVPRKQFGADGRILRNEGGYGFWTWQIAQAGDAPFIRLNELSADALDEIVRAMGPEALDEYFCGDHTHSSRKGAELNAAMTVRGIGELERCSLNSYLRN